MEGKAMSYGMDDKVVVVTGAGSGIGLAIARRFMEEGARVVGGDIDVAAFEALSGRGGAIAVRADLRADGAAQMVDTAIKRFGSIDVLVCCAGVSSPREGVLKTTDADFLSTFDVNVMGIVRTCRAALPHMVERGKGSIISIASDFGRMPSPYYCDYCVSKAAVLNFMKSVSIEFGPLGIRANCVSPGATRTPMWDRPGGMIDVLCQMYGGMGREEAVEHFAKVDKKFALQRIGRPEEIAEVVLFLASDKASFVTGSDYWVNGGSMPVF
ncbi:MAG: SDR family oxidoreductase [Thermodesulfobacteriota bacterium]|jgi:NAD(P)-dependent dehydrogenase (short-subunit alcohol dehydrogenase family)